MFFWQYITRFKAWLVFFCYALFLLFLSISKDLGYFTPELRMLQQTLGGDKNVHFIAALLLAVSATFLLNYKQAKWLSKLIFMFVVIASLLAADELLQFFFKTRIFEIYDLYYGWAGLSVGAVLGLLINYLKSRCKIDEYKANKIE